jgi:hypothetical protein
MILTLREKMFIIYNNFFNNEIYKKINNTGTIMKQDFEHRNKEREIFYQSFESYITGILPPSSPQLLDSLKNFIQQPIELQKNILKEIALKNGVSIIPLVKQFISQNENVAEMLIEVLMEDANEITASILSGLAEEINEKRTKKLFKKALYKRRR